MIKKLRIKSKLSQTNAAKKIGINAAYYCRVESGKIPLPPKYFKPAAKTFKTTIKKLVAARVREFRQKLLAELNG